MKTKHSAKTVEKERYKLCPNCKNFIPFEIQDKYCYLCGEVMLESCPACNEPIIYPTSTYCPVCGALLVRINSNKEKEK